MDLTPGDVGSFLYRGVLRVKIHSVVHDKFIAEPTVHFSYLDEEKNRPIKNSSVADIEFPMSMAKRFFKKDF